MFPGAGWHEMALVNARRYRYYRAFKFILRSDSTFELAELEFHVGEVSPDRISIDRLSGPTFGSGAASGSDYASAFDGDPATFFEGVNDSSHVGLDVSSGVLKRIRYHPAQSRLARVPGARIQGSREGSGDAFANLYTIPPNGANAGWHEANIDNAANYRRYRYRGGTGGTAIAELEFHGTEDPLIRATGRPFGSNPVTLPGETAAIVGHGSAFDGLPSTHFSASGRRGGHVGIDLDGTAAGSGVLQGVRFYPSARRSSARSTDFGYIEGSQDKSTYTTLYTFSEEPSIGWHRLLLDNTTAYRYYRFRRSNAVGSWPALRNWNSGWRPRTPRWDGRSRCRAPLRRIPASM